MVAFKQQKHPPRHCINTSVTCPCLLLWGVCQHPGDEDPVRDQLQPSVDKARSFGRPQDVESVAVDKGKKRYIIQS